MRRMRSGWVVLFPGVALLAASPVWADIELSQKVDRTVVGTEDTFRLSVVEVDAPPSAQLQLPELRDFEVLSKSLSRQRSIDLSGGGPAVIRDITTHTLHLRATRTGKLTIPPAVLAAAGRTYKTQPIEMTVKPGWLGPVRPPLPDPFRNFPSSEADVPPPEAVDALQEGDAPVTPEGDSSVFLWASLDRDQVYVGEQTTLSLYIYSRVELSSVDALTLPKLEDFWGEDLQRPTQLSGKERIVNGVPYRAYLLRRRALFPMKTGTLTIPPAEADITTGPLFAGNRVQRASNGLEVKVEPLPPGGPPGIASANVGSWKLSVDVSPTRVELGLPVTVMVMLEGTGNVTNVMPPKLMAPAGLKVYEPITLHQLPFHPKELQGRQMQAYMVVPLRAGTFTLPAMEFPYFDLRRRKYDVARTSPVTVTVKGGAGGVASTGSAPPSMESGGGMEGAAAASPSALQEACDGGEVRSCSLLGELYHVGRGVPRDGHRAAALYEKACTGKVAQGCHYLGLLYAEGRGVPKDENRAAALYEKACKAGEAQGCRNLGGLYKDGRGIPKNLRRAATLYGKACAGGEAMSCSLLGSLHEEGLGVPKDGRRAATLFGKACAGGYALACNTLSLRYLQGRGVPQNNFYAVVLSQEACEGGSAEGCFTVGGIYAEGRGVPKDESRAAVLSEKACEGGEALGCYNLGVLYAEGRGVPKDENRAAALYEKACEGGVANGCSNLGSLYRKGSGVPKDESRAAVLYEKACEGGVAKGCHNLALLYREGLGVPKDASRAATFFEKSCRAGFSADCASGSR